MFAQRLPVLALLLVLPAPFLPAVTGVGSTYHFPHMVDIRDPTDTFTHQFAIAGSSPSSVYGGEAMAYTTVPDTGTYYVVVTTPWWTTASWVAWSYRLFVHVAN